MNTPPKNIIYFPSILILKMYIIFVIINVIYNILTDNDEDKRKKGNFIDDYNNVEVRDSSNNEHKCDTSFGKCYLF